MKTLRVTLFTLYQNCVFSNLIKRIPKMEVENYGCPIVNGSMFGKKVQILGKLIEVSYIMLIDWLCDF